MGRKCVYRTVKVAFLVVPRYVPEIVDVVRTVTGLVVTVKVVLLDPPGIVAVTGTWATVVLLLLREITAPDGGAAPFSVRVPVEDVPPVTLVGFKISELNVATVTVIVLDLVVVP